MTESRNALSPGYQLHWYVIQKVLGQGGFGITYLAEDTNLNRKVAIKEYLPVEIAVRESDSTVSPVSGDHGSQYQWGLDRFISEAQTLARFSHPNIVRVLAVFPANHTAYMIMEFEQGEPLHEILRRRRTLPVSELHELLLPLLDGLEQVHAAGFIHRDIKPPNIYIRDNGNPVLLDFGSARQSFGLETRTLTTMVSPGYAPFEQYTSKGERQGPWTDIYGLAATLYRSVTGVSPANAMDRSESILNTGKDLLLPAGELRTEGYGTAFLSAIDHGLTFRAEERPQSIRAWRAELGWVDQAAEAPSAGEATTQRIDMAPVEKTTVIAPRETEASTFIDIGKDTARIEQVPTPSGSGWRKPALALVASVVAMLLLAAVIRNWIESALHVPAPVAVTQEQDIAVGRQEEREITAVQTRDPQPATSPHVDSPGQPGQKPVLRDAENPPQVAESPARNESAEVEAPARTSLLSKEDRQNIAALQSRLKRNPRDEQAAGELREKLRGYLKQIQGAVRQGDLVQAESWVEEIRPLDPENRNLTRAVELIRKARRQAAATPND